MNEGQTEQTEVLVVGGGVTGLSAALFLRAHGVRVVVAERHRGTSIHPRAWGWYSRTLEQLRWAGVADAVLAEAQGYSEHRLQAKVESLAGREISSTKLPAPEDLSDLTPAPQISLGQNRVEAKIREGAEGKGADLRFHTEVVSVEQDANGVTALLRHRETGEERTVRARYAIAADGPRSSLREALGIGRTGSGTLRHQLSILFQADMTGPLAGRKFSLCQVENDLVSGVLGINETGQKGTLITTYHPEQGDGAESYDKERARELVRSAIGADTDIFVADVLPWEMAALVAERLRSGRIFIAGDAAHVVPPVGGFGANTGIHDVHNLAWKLAKVLRGEAGEELLDTYEAERLPVARRTVEQAQLRLAFRAGYADDDQKARLRDPLAVTLGHTYGDGLPEFIEPQDLAAEPGSRAPHLPVLVDGEEKSLLDLYGDAFVLLTGAESAEWPDAATAAGRTLGVRVDAYRVGIDVKETTAAWGTVYTAPENGAVLVRPDGFVAWRSAGAAPGTHAAELTAALRGALAR
ncbi:FAD-dependent oxidoreductase [Streptomyces sp. NPDC056817]|uniref:FAD-dependent oxidoreductase n=1 Tax=Streptomyces sp. NPDC056817 TaxID=3345950 RepID=UPI0036C5936E